MPWETATTDSDGNFSFDRRSRDQWGMAYVGVMAKGFAPALQGLLLDPGTPEIIVRLQKGKIILGRVIDSAGHPVAGAEVGGTGPWYTNGDNFLIGKTDAEGRFRWTDAPETPVQIWAFKPGYEDSDYLFVTPTGKEVVLVLKDKDTKPAPAQPLAPAVTPSPAAAPAAVPAAMADAQAGLLAKLMTQEAELQAALAEKRRVLGPNQADVKKLEVQLAALREVMEKYRTAAPAPATSGRRPPGPTSEDLRPPRTAKLADCVISGAITRPGIYSLVKEGEQLLELVAMAGGLEGKPLAGMIYRPMRLEEGNRLLAEAATKGETPPQVSGVTVEWDKLPDTLRAKLASLGIHENGGRWERYISFDPQALMRGDPHQNIVLRDGDVVVFRESADGPDVEMPAVAAPPAKSSAANTKGKP